MADGQTATRHTSYLEGVMKRRSGKPGTEGEIVKTTIRLPRPLWDKLRHRAVDQNTDLQTLVARALSAYLKGSQQ
jgi:hypothetical protein